MPGSELSLREWISTHRVTWELLPHFAAVDDGTEQVGYDLALYARHPPRLVDDPGCPECIRIHDGLRDVVARALPHDQAPDTVAIAPFRPQIAMRAESGWEPEVELDVEVLHRGGHGHADSSDAAHAHALEAGLLRLGAQKGSWQRHW